jgi:hypothetical protein
MCHAGQQRRAPGYREARRRLQRGREDPMALALTGDSSTPTTAWRGGVHLVEEKEKEIILFIAASEFFR